MTTANDTDPSEWMEFAERLGLPALMFFFLCVVVFKLGKYLISKIEPLAKGFLKQNEDLFDEVKRHNKEVEGSLRELCSEMSNSSTAINLRLSSLENVTGRIETRIATLDGRSAGG